MTCAVRLSPPVPCHDHLVCVFFFFNDTATTEIYTLSLHDALPISCRNRGSNACTCTHGGYSSPTRPVRSEEHTSELQSRPHLVCRLLLAKKSIGKTEPANAIQSRICIVSDQSR